MTEKLGFHHAESSALPSESPSSTAAQTSETGHKTGHSPHSLRRFLLKWLGCFGLATAFALGGPAMSSDAASKSSKSSKKKSKNKKNKQRQKSKVVEVEPQGKKAKKNQQLNQKNKGKQLTIMEEIEDAPSRGLLNSLISRAISQNLVNNAFITSMQKCIIGGNDRMRRNCAYTLSLTAEPRFANIIAPRLAFETMNAEEMEIRTNCAKALGRLGPNGAARATPALVKALEDRGAPTRREAATALGKLKAKKQGPDVLKVATNPEEITETRQAAILALGEMGYTAGASDLNDLLKDGREIIRLTAARALCMLNQNSGRSFAEQMARSQDEYQRKDVVWLLGGINQKWATDNLVMLLDDTSVSVQIEAAKALALNQNQKGITWLVLRAKQALDENDFDLSNRLEQAIEDAKISSTKRKAVLAK